MAVEYSITKHTRFFPTKIASGTAGSPHIVNVTLAADKDNGVICSLGNFIELDNYAWAAPKTGDGAFAGKIIAKSARGDFYVEVTSDVNVDNFILYNEPIIPEAGYGRKFGMEENFYNANGDVVRAYGLIKHDIFEISENGFSGTPVVGKTVTANANGKLVVGA